MQNKYCSKCGKALNIEDKASGKCHSCGQPLNKTAHQNSIKLYDVYLENYGNDKDKCVSLISEILSIDLDSAKNKVENIPILLLDSGTEPKMKYLSKRFSELQAKVVIKAHSSQANNVPKNTTINQIPYEVDDKTSNSKKSNGISTALGVCGIIFIIIGLIFGFQFAKLGFQYFLLSLFASIVIGLFFLGMAEIIQLLDDIKHK